MGYIVSELLSAHRETYTDKMLQQSCITEPKFILSRKICNYNTFEKIVVFREKMERVKHDLFMVYSYFYSESIV